MQKAIIGLFIVFLTLSCKKSDDPAPDKRGCMTGVSEFSGQLVELGCSYYGSFTIHQKEWKGRYKDMKWFECDKCR